MYTVCDLGILFSLSSSLDSFPCNYDRQDLRGALCEWSEHNVRIKWI